MGGFESMLKKCLDSLFVEKIPRDESKRALFWNQNNGITWTIFPQKIFQDSIVTSMIFSDFHHFEAREVYLGKISSHQAGKRSQMVVICRDIFLPPRKNMLP